MNKEIRTEIKELYSSIDHCIDQLINGRASHDDAAIANAQHKMESLMVETQQVLSRINDSLIEPASKDLEEAAVGVGSEFRDALIRDGCDMCHAEIYAAIAQSNFKAGARWQHVQSPSRMRILNVWELGNWWKELTKGSISTEHGTQLEYIQKHWDEGEYYDKICKEI